jgi:hypothetical protein
LSFFPCSFAFAPFFFVPLPSFALLVPFTFAPLPLCFCLFFASPFGPPLQALIFLLPARRLFFLQKETASLAYMM